MLHVAMISKWHVHAKDYAQQLLQRSDKVQITCLWDEDEARGRAWAEELGVDFEQNYDTLLARSDVDGVVIDTATAVHHEIIIKAAKAKKHIFTEKVLAPTVRECVEIAQAIRENDVAFCISYPQLQTPAFRYAKQLVDDGTLGTISSMRVRNGHDGAIANWLPQYWYHRKDACGGVMLDLGCHPMYLVRWILGAPKSVNSNFSYLTNREVEDSATCTIAFENGAVAITESSFVAPASPYIMEVYGDKGTIIVIDNEVTVMLKKDRELIKQTPAQLPEPPLAAIDQWIEACETGSQPVECGLEEAIHLTELMEAAYIAETENRTVSISELKRS